MWAFDVDNLPETFQFVAEIEDIEAQKELTRLLSKVWFRAVILDVPQILQDWVLEDYAANYSDLNEFETSFHALQILAKDIFFSADMCERFYYACNEKDPNDDFRDFLADNGITGDADDNLPRSDIGVLVDSISIGTDDWNEIEEEALSELTDEYALLYGRTLTDDQEEELRKIIGSILDDIQFTNKFKFMEEETMKANYQKIVDNANAIADAMLALKTCLAEEDNIETNQIIEEFRNNYLNALAKDASLARKSNRRKWAHSLLCHLAEPVPQISPIIGNPEAEDLIIEKICNPIINDIRNAPAGAAPDNVKNIISESENDGPATKTNIFIRFTSRLKKFFCNLMRGIKKLFSKLREKAIDVGAFFHDHAILSSILHFLHISGVAIGSGNLAAYVASKFGVSYASGLLVSGTYGIIIFLAGAVLAIGYEFIVRKMFIKFVNWAYEKKNPQTEFKVHANGVVYDAHYDTSCNG
mgnify:CR=1 FL=1